jgi:hypothetical protein
MTRQQMYRKRRMESTQLFLAEISQAFTLFLAQKNWNSATARRRNY